MKHFGLIGYPLGHSASGEYFTRKFSLEAIDAEYTLYPIEEISYVEDLVDRLSGFNVTIPYKKQIIPYLKGISPEAQAIGAVNCVKVSTKGLHGFNTDIIGIRETLAHFDGLEGKRALILGTGGAAAAVEYALKEKRMDVKFVSRHECEGGYTYSELSEEIISQTKLIVNATPCGMYPHTDEAPQIPYQALSEEHCLFDLIYNPIKTRFLKLGEMRGAKCMSGMEMFRSQAEASWRIWNSDN